MKVNSNRIPQDEYNNFLEKMVLCCVDVVIVQDKKVLLVKRNTEPANGEWWVPGGRVRKGELLEDCAIRKAKEEVGIDCRINRQLDTKETLFDSGPEGIPIHSINVCFLLEPINKDNEIKLDNYSSDYKWVSNIPSDIRDSYIISIIYKALPNIGADRSNYMMTLHPY